MSLKLALLALPALSLAACAPSASPQMNYTSTTLGTTTPAATTPASTTPAATTPATTTPVSTTPASTTPSTTTSSTAAAPSYKTVTPLTTTPVRTFTKAEQVIQPGKQYRAILNTSKGNITIDLNAKASPIAVNNFVFLALNHFYDGTRFHRVLDGFVAQGGDPLSADTSKQAAWGTGGPGYNFTAEVNNGLRFDQAGVLGMARAASLSSQGSQFYITLAPADFLSGQYTVFGQVVAGQDVLAALTRTSRSTSGGEQAIAGAQADVLTGVTIQVLE